MVLLNMDGVYIQNRYSMTDPETGLIFNDAIILPIADYNALTSDQITAIKQQRFTDWLTTITTPTDPSLIPVDPVQQVILADLEAA